MMRTILIMPLILLLSMHSVNARAMHDEQTSVKQLSFCYLKNKSFFYRVALSAGTLVGGLKVAIAPTTGVCLSFAPNISYCDGNPYCTPFHPNCVIVGTIFGLVGGLVSMAGVAMVAAQLFFAPQEVKALKLRYKQASLVDWAYECASSAASIADIPLRSYMDSSDDLESGGHNADLLAQKIILAFEGASFAPAAALVTGIENQNSRDINKFLSFAWINEFAESKPKEIAAILEGIDISLLEERRNLISEALARYREEAASVSR